MAKHSASRKYQITINNPVEHGFSHDSIKQILSGFSGLEYWCLCDEVGDNGTPHTHVYCVFTNAVMFTTLQKRFYGSHIEPALGSNQENRDYIRKEGKWADDAKKETNLSDAFEESGDLPPDRAEKGKETTAIYEMVKQGANNFEILEAYPNAMNRLEKVDRARQTVLEYKYEDGFRELDVTYIWGKNRCWKTRSVMEKHGYPNVYRVTNYVHPFDAYKGQDVILFEEYRSNLLISDMLIYLDGYPVTLPCRYADKQACYTKVYIISNIPLEQQYPNVQMEQPATWAAFLRRINHNHEMLPPCTLRRGLDCGIGGCMMLNKYPDVMTVDEVSEALGICKNKIYDLIRHRIIGSKKVGRRIIVPKVCLIDFLEFSRYNISQ